VLGGEDHEGGTLPLGTVLDDRHRLAGIAGLYVAGPATFPRMGAANPGLTTMALAPVVPGHEWSGVVHATAYDLSSILILWPAGASAIAGPINIGAGARQRPEGCTAGAASRRCRRVGGSRGRQSGQATLLLATPGDRRRRRESERWSRHQQDRP
jgi:hypothetical protein